MLLDLQGPLDLAASIEGQAFRWRRDGDWWAGVLGGNAVRLRVPRQGGPPQLEAESDPQHPEALASLLRDYLDLDTDVDAVRAALAVAEPVLVEALAASAGLRLLRQDPWETLVAFILSQNSNIPRIQQNIEDLSVLAGSRFEARGRTFYAFPSPHALSRLSEETLRLLRLGYRAPSVLAAAQRVAGGRLDLEVLQRSPYAEARAALVALPGVGPKVADCVLAYGLGHREAFPVDTWVEKAVLRLWPGEVQGSRERLAAWGRARFGSRAAYAQQVLFYAERRRALGRRTAERTRPRPVPSARPAISRRGIAPRPRF